MKLENAGLVNFVLYIFSVNLENFSVGDVMNSPVSTMHSTESVCHLATLLLTTEHGAFPVVKYDETTRSEHIHGIISRLEQRKN